MEHRAGSTIRPFVIGLSCLASLWCAHGCLAPGSLDNEAAFRVQRDGAVSPGGGTSQTEGGAEVGCKAACTTFQTTCAASGCHNPDDLASNLDLKSAGIVKRISGTDAESASCLGQTLLVPGNPAKSLVYTKLAATPACGIRMPLTGMLSASDIDCVRRWTLAPECDDGVPDASVGSGGTNGTGGASAGGMSGSGGSGNGGMSSSGGMNGNGGSGAGGKSNSGGMNGNGGSGAGGKNGTGGKNATGGKSGSGGASNAGGTNGNGGMNGNGGSGAGGMPATGSVIYVEAESGSLSDPMVSANDGNASGGKYVSVPTASATNADPTMSTMGIATINFTVTSSGNYGAFGRIIAMSTSSDSFWVKMDGGSWVQWNNLTTGTAWVWDDIHDSSMADAPVHYMLDPGMHTFYVAYREAGAELDKLAFATDSGFTPTGLGQ
ncbi:MAG TPA: hypothetical protein VH062_16290 [Polyangiaceae bacterium]|nr:hypothetical protein [Polyangiaceae bacterium]